MRRVSLKLLVAFCVLLYSKANWIENINVNHIPRPPFSVLPSAFRLPGFLHLADGDNSVPDAEPALGIDLAAVPDDAKMLFQGALSGALAGSITQLCLHPIDTVKTRMQVRGLAALRLRPSNLKALYAGVTSNVLGEAPSSALFYATYETIVRKVLPKVDEDKRSLVHLAAASVASVVSSVIRVPSEVLKTQLQSGKTFGNRQTIAKILRGPNGWKGMFAGYGPFLLRDVPFDAIQFMMYELVRFQYIRGVCFGEREPTKGENAVLGAIAGGVAGAVTTPFDVVRAELMCSSMLGTEGPGYTRMGEVVVDIFRKEGAAGFMRGVWARVGWLAAGGCIFFPALEASKKLLRTVVQEEASESLVY